LKVNPVAFREKMFCSLCSNLIKTFTFRIISIWKSLQKIIFNEITLLNFNNSWSSVSHDQNLYKQHKKPHNKERNKYVLMANYTTSHSWKMRHENLPVCTNKQFTLLSQPAQHLQKWWKGPTKPFWLRVFHHTSLKHHPLIFTMCPS